MSVTVIVWVALYLLAIVGALANPLFGLFGYLLEYFQRPDLYWWGKPLPNFRWNFIIGAVATAAYFLHRGTLQPFQRHTMVPLVLLILQAVNTSIVGFWAVSPEMNLKWSIQYWKLVVTFMLFSEIVRTRRSLDLVILFQIVGAAWWGWDGLDAKREQTRLEGVGSGDTLNSNLLAAHLLTIIPLGVLFAITKRPTWMRAAAILGTPLILNLVVLANSRGATLGLLASGASSLFLVRRELRKRVVLLGFAGLFALWVIADPQFIARQQSTVSADDHSAASRLELWGGALQLIKDYPLGTGARGFHRLSPQYVPTIQVDKDDGEGRSAHNTYLQIAAEFGLQGLALFVAFICYTFKLLQCVRRERASVDWPYYASLGLQLGLIGTLTAAFFSNRFFGESTYWICGLSLALYRMTSPAEAAATTDTPANGRLPRVAA